MSNELTTNTENKIALLNKQELSDIVKPLNREIYLFDTFIAGTLLLRDPELLKKVEVGEKLVLRREEKIYDSNCINIYNSSDEKLGFIPEKDNVVFARLMDAGKCLIAKVSDIQDKSHMKVITIGIYLVDF